MAKDPDMANSLCNKMTKITPGPHVMHSQKIEQNLVA